MSVIITNILNINNLFFLKKGRKETWRFSVDHSWSKHLILSTLESRRIYQVMTQTSSHITLQNSKLWICPTLTCNEKMSSLTLGLIRGTADVKIIITYWWARRLKNKSIIRTRGLTYGNFDQKRSMSFPGPEMWCIYSSILFLACTCRK